MHVPAPIVGQARCAPRPEEAALVGRLARYDFSAAAHTHLVASTPCHAPLNPPPPPEGTLATARCALAGAAHARPPPGALEPLLQQLRAAADAQGLVHLTLRPMPHNPHDANAVAVQLPPRALDGCGLPDRGRLGFLPREVAAWVAPLLRSGRLAFRATCHWQDVLGRRSHLFQEVLALHAFRPEAAAAAASPPHAHAPAAAAAGPPPAEGLVQLLGRAERPQGLHRLQQLMGRHRWPTEAPKAHWYASSSVGNVAGNRRFLQAWCRATGASACEPGGEAFDDEEEEGRGGFRELVSGVPGELPFNVPEVLFPSAAWLRAHRDAAIDAARREAAMLVPGARVVVRGLQNKPEFNGRKGELQPNPRTVEGGLLRWNVRLEGGKDINVAEARLEATAVAAGRRVLVPPAFTALPEGHGCCGTAVALTDDGRWRVRLEHGMKAADGRDEALVPEARLHAAPPRLPWLNYMMTPKTFESAQRLEEKRMQPWKDRRDRRSLPKPPALLRACEQTTGKTGIQHSKVYVRRFSNGCGAVYLGSHNFSPAAWGAPRILVAGTEERRGAVQVLWVANYEYAPLWRWNPRSCRDQLGICYSRYPPPVLGQAGRAAPPPARRARRAALLVGPAVAARLPAGQAAARRQERQRRDGAAGDAGVDQEARLRDVRDVPRRGAAARARRQRALLGGGRLRPMRVARQRSRGRRGRRQRRRGGVRGRAEAALAVDAGAARQLCDVIGRGSFARRMTATMGENPTLDTHKLSIGLLALRQSCVCAQRGLCSEC